MFAFLCYNATMPWDYTETEYQKQAKADPVWELERIICYGVPDWEQKKIKVEVLKKYFHQLRIPDDRKAFLELLLWNKPF